MDLFDLYAKLTLDSSGYENALDSAKTATESLQTDMAGADTEAGNLQSGLNDLGTEVNDEQSVIDELASALAECATETDSASSSAQGLSGDFQSAEGDADTLATDLDGLGEAAESLSGSMDGAGESSENLFDNVAVMQGAEELLQMIGSIGEAVTEMTASYDESSAAIAQGTGATGEVLETFQQQATDAFSTIADSDQDITSVSEALAELNTRFGLTGTELDTATEDVLKYAKATGTDATTAVDDLADVMKRWGIDSSDMSTVMDELTVASQMSGQSVGNLSDALSTGSVSFSELGLSMEDALTYLTVWTNNGANMSSITTGMRNAVNNLSEAGGDVPSNFQAAIEAIQDADSASEALTAEVGDTGLTVKEVFGSKAAQEIITAVQSTGDSFDDYSEAIANSGGAMEQTYEDSITLNDNLSLIKKSFQLIAQSSIAPVFSEVAETLAQIITPMASVIEESPVLQALIASLATAFTVMATAITAVLVVKKVTSAFNSLGVSFTTIASNPVLLIVAALAALATAIVYLWNNCEEFREGVIAIWNAIKTTISTVVTAIQTTITNVWTAISTSVTAIVTAIQTTVTNIWNAIKTAVTTVITTIQTTITTVWTAISTTVNTLVTGIQTTITTIFTTIKTKISTILTSIKTTFTNIWTSIKTTVNTLVTGIKTTIVNIITTIKTNVSTILTNIKTTFTNIWTSIKTTVSTLVTGLKTSVVSIVTGIKTSVSTIITAIKTKFTDIFSGIKEKVMTILTGLTTKIKSWGTSLKSSFLSIGKNLILGLWNGISDKVDWVISKIKSLGESVIKAAKSIFGISSPSKVFAEIGGYLAEGLGEGWEDEIEDVKAGIENDLDFGTVAQADSALGLAGSISGTGGVTVVQNIYSKAQTAADLLKEARWNQEKAVLRGVYV